MRRKAGSLCPGSLPPLKIKNAGAVWQALRRDAVMSLGNQCRQPNMVVQPLMAETCDSSAGTQLAMNGP